jgi:hypothetical protein
MKEGFPLVRLVASCSGENQAEPDRMVLAVPAFVGFFVHNALTFSILESRL